MPTMRKIKDQETKPDTEQEVFYAIDISQIESGEFNIGPCSSLEELNEAIAEEVVTEEVEARYAILKQIAVVDVSVQTETKVKFENV